MASPSSNALARQGPVILAVDDDPGILRIIEMLLSRAGYTVKTAPSAPKALDLLKGTLPSLMITDVQMPAMSGYDLCQVVKRDKRLQNMPVLFLTAQGSPQDYKTGHDSGAVMYMVKPFKPEVLLNAVRMMVPIPHPGQNADPAPKT